MHDEELVDIETMIAEFYEAEQYRLDKLNIPAAEMNHCIERGIRIGHA